MREIPVLMDGRRVGYCRGLWELTVIADERLRYDEFVITDIEARRKLQARKDLNLGISIACACDISIPGQSRITSISIITQGDR